MINCNKAIKIGHDTIHSQMITYTDCNVVTSVKWDAERYICYKVHEGIEWYHDVKNKIKDERYT